MQYVNFGNTGLVVSRLCFGAMTFGEGTLVGDWKSEVGQEVANKMVNLALDSGVNFFDTADMYTSGQSETILGKALKEKRKDVVIATKCGFRSGESVISSGSSYRYILQAVEGSLEKLDTDYIDILLVHIPDPVTPLEETARALDDIVKQGWVRYVGLSNYPAWKAQKLLDIQKYNGYEKVIAAQMYYSLLGRDLEEEFVPFMQDNNISLMAWSPLASGFLTGKYTKENPVPEDSRRAKFDFPPIDVEKGYEVIAKLKGIAEKHNATIPQVAIAWILAKDYASTVIIGANKIHQLDDNLGSVNVKLDEDDVKELDDLTVINYRYPGWMQAMGIDPKIKDALGL